MRNVIGYLLGFLFFVVGIPMLMWWFSERPISFYPSMPWMALSIIMMISGLSLSIWSIIHMRKVGEGNPFDAFNHEAELRTKHLMTEGPYRFSRNPMLLGIYIYDIGVLLWLQSWLAICVFVGQAIVLSVQVLFEEKRLEADFGEEYRAYKQSVPRYLFKSRRKS